MDLTSWPGCRQAPVNFPVLCLSAGYCIGVPLDDNEAFIASFVVSSEFRGKGIGTELLKRVVQSLGDRNISLYAALPAESLYKRVGFTTGDKPSYLHQVKIIPNREGFTGNMFNSVIHYFPKSKLILHGVRTSDAVVNNKYKKYVASND